MTRCTRPTYTPAWRSPRAPAPEPEPEQLDASMPWLTCAAATVMLATAWLVLIGFGWVVWSVVT